MRIVIAEDEERSRKGITWLIRSISEQYYVVGQAIDGRQALEMIRMHRPAVVLTDIQMPFMDGLALVKAAHEENLYPHFAIISAYADFEYAKKAISLGVKEYIVKPVTYDEVELVLNKLSRMPRDARYARMPMREGTHPLVTSVLNEIEKNYHQRISLESLAEMLEVTPEYLSTLFSREMRENFSTYLQRFRVEKAKERLRGGESRIYEIAADLGFSDVKYFCRVFKKITGQTPSDYAKVHQQESI